MIDKISEAKSIKELQLSLLQRKELMSTPVLTDLDQIKRIYDIFNYVESYCNTSAIKGSVFQKKRFCFIILKLYSPGTILFGDRLIRGLRENIALAIGVKHLSAISDYCDNVISFYKIYRDFRDDIEYLYDKIVPYLKAEKIII